jgi:phosphotransferase system enzyme I (PtsP)
MSKDKDKVDMICDIAELTRLFEQSRGLSDFLQSAISVIAWHMRAAVCSIYLYDDRTQELVLAANQGLNPEFIGKLRLKLGEGLVGTALKELRSIREAHANHSPPFKLIPGLEEEKFAAFLAVPIVRGLSRIGVLAVQDPQPSYFSARDEKAFRAIAQQLATVIENAKLLLEIHKFTEQTAPSRPPELAELRFLKGVSAGEGIVRGSAMVIGSQGYDPLAAVPPAGREESPEQALARFQQALDVTEAQLSALQASMEEQMADIASLIFSAHLLILKDEEFSGSMREKVVAGEPPERAVAEVVNQFIALFARSPNPRMQEKVHDLKDLGHRLLQNLSSEPGHEADYHGQVVITGEILPSDVVKLAAQRAEGLLIVQGGGTAHVAILARSLGLPVIFIDNRRLLQVPDGTRVILDANQGTVFVDPDETIQANYDKALALDRARLAELRSRVAARTATADGTEVTLMANINLLSDLRLAVDFKSEGVGLYRSEFPFIVRSSFPSEEEQVNIYRRIADAMPHQDIVLRTLDVGGDKLLPYGDHQEEANPFLGLRAIRFTLRNLPVFTAQLRAMLRACAGARLHIMFPFISSLDDFEQACAITRDCLRDLRQEGVPHHPDPQLGAMVELPAAVEIIDELAAAADFLCIGTNDLIQYTLAVDRTNERVQSLYIGHHPAVLRALKRIADGCARYQTSLSLCGDMALDRRMIPFLLGIGLRILSMDPRHLPEIQQHIAGLSLPACRRQAEELLRLGRIREVEERLAAPLAE